MSKDPVSKQKRFVDKYGFPFPMLCDESGETVSAYHAWGQKSFIGRKYDGILRIAYLIDGEGKIEQVYGKVRTTRFAKDVLKSL